MTSKELCNKYPFLSWYGNPLFVGYSEEEAHSQYTWEHELPDGWRKAFCPQIWDELKAILEKADYVDKFRFTQIKEKYGTLRLYHIGVPESIYDEVSAWENKYEKLSEETCITCGKSATHMTLGWINFICEECKNFEQTKVIPIEDAEIYFNNPEEYFKTHKI